MIGICQRRIVQQHAHRAGLGIIDSSSVRRRVRTASALADRRHWPQGRGNALGSATRFAAHTKLQMENEIACSSTVLAVHLAEVDHDVRAFRRRERQSRSAQQARQQSLIRSDLMRTSALFVEREAIEPAVRSVHHAETILSRLHIQVGQQLSVDKNQRSEIPRAPMERPDFRDTG